MKKTYYEILGVSSQVAPAELKTAIRTLLQKHHPSKHPNDPQAPTRFKQLQAMEKILLDPQKRAAYDASLTATANSSKPKPATGPTRTKTNAVKATKATTAVKATSATPSPPPPELAVTSPAAASVVKPTLATSPPRNESPQEEIKKEVEHEWLDRGEKIIYRAHLHWALYVKPLFTLLLPAYLLFVNPDLLTQLEFLQKSLQVITIGLQSLMGIAVLMIIAAVYKQLTTLLWVTSKRLLFKSSWSAKPHEILHFQFEHLQVNTGILGKVFGYGSIKARGTRGRGVGGLKIQCSYVSSPNTFEKKLLMIIKSSVEKED